ncbi:MAG: phosphomethylpyrimidine synthase ThiC [bacterium]
MTQRQKALQGDITPQMECVSRKEGISTQNLLEGIAKGQIVIAYSHNHPKCEPIGIGSPLSIKINSNIGTSKDCALIEEEFEKLRISIDYGADTVMDLSTGGDLNKIRSALIHASSIPVGTVPIYQTAIESAESKGAIIHMNPDDIFGTIEKHAKDGVAFITVHCGLTREALNRLVSQGRCMGIVSRGGSFLVHWMIANDKENPLFEHYDRLLEIALKYDIVLSLGDGLRPGAIEDATDRAQIQELIILGELTKRAWDAGVQVMIEGPGHMSIEQIEGNVLLEKRICMGAPFYVLGPLVTDIAPGYDHITSAIGGAIAAKAGADFLCYVTPSEHLRLPTKDDVKIGVIAAKIAAHAADLAKGNQKAREKNRQISEARYRQDWEEQFKLSIDPALAEGLRKERKPSLQETCSMCGEYCAINMVRDYLRSDTPRREK